MKLNLTKSLLAFLIPAVLLSSCKKDLEATEDNEEEVITTMKLTFVPVGGGATLSYEYDDADGPGGATPTVQEIVLAPSRLYAVTVQLLNKTANPVADITEEVAEENTAHRFYYLPSANSGVTVNALNSDSNGVPLGITSSWSTGSASANGTIRVVLRHYPGTPPGKLNGDAVDSPKSGSDIDVSFVVKVQ